MNNMAMWLKFFDDWATKVQEYYPGAWFRHSVGFGMGLYQDPW